MDILTIRQQEIVSILNEKERISVNELAAHFQVTPATIRRELTLLAQKNLITRKHGYACLNDRAPRGQSPFNIRLALHRDEKSLIAQRALQYLTPDATSIILDSGTSTYTLAEMMAQDKSGKHISVISNCLPIASCCPGSYNMICGGSVDEDSLSLIGHEAEAYFDAIWADIAFLGANGVWGTEGPSVSSFFQMGIKKKMLSCANKSILLLDSYKFKSKGLSKLCSFRDLYAVITVRTESNAEQIDHLRSAGIRVDCANEPGDT